MRNLLFIFFVFYSTIALAQNMQELARLNKSDADYAICAGMVGGHSQELLVYGLITEEEFWDVGMMTTTAHMVHVINWAAGGANLKEVTELEKIVSKLQDKEFNRHAVKLENDTLTMQLIADIQMCHVFLANTAAQFDGNSLKLAYDYLGIEHNIITTYDALEIVKEVVDGRRKTIERLFK
jgi:hypothetical protein